MIAYNNLWLDNLAVRESIDDAFDANAITKEEKLVAETQYPVGFYTPNYFIRIGLFVLTGIITSCSFGLICLILMGVIEHIFSGVLLCFGILAYAMLEYFVTKKHHYRSGVDDALLWTSGICIVSAINLMYNVPSAANALLIFILATYLTIRFADMLMAAVATAALMAFIFFTYIHFGSFAKASISFLIMIAAAVIYIIAKSNASKISTKYYQNCNITIQIISLLAFYSASNYFIVRELSNSIFNLGLQPQDNIPLSSLFWTFTIAIPILYIIFGLRKKDVVLLRVGLLLVAAIVFTIRNYYTIMPLEMLMVWGGIALTIFAYAVTRWLATPKKGFTSAEGSKKYLLDNMNVEALIIAETFSNAGPAPETKFGGGNFGGGGASGEF